MPSLETIHLYSIMSIKRNALRITRKKSVNGREYMSYITEVFAEVQNRVGQFAFAVAKLEHPFRNSADVSP